MKKIFIASLLSLNAVASMAFAGDYDVSGIDRTRTEALGEGRAETGVVVSVREVEIQSSTASQLVSTSAGTILGGALGAKIGNGNGKLVTGALLGLLGGTAGNLLGDKLASAQAQEIIVKKQSGVLSVVTQADSNLTVGQSVYVVTTQGKTRVVPDPTVVTSY